MSERPFVFLSTAMSLDGKISTCDKNPHTEICENDDYALRWQDRIDADAVFIGANQLRLDDPKLTVKTEERVEKRVALGKSREPAKAAVVSDLGTLRGMESGDFFTAGEKKILFTTGKTSQENLEHFKELAEVYVIGE